MSTSSKDPEQQTIERLQRTNDLLNKAAKIARIGCFDWKIEADRAIWSQEMYEILGLDPDEIGQDDKAEVVFNLMHPDDVERVTEAHLRGLREKRIIPSEFRIIRSDETVVTSRSIPQRWERR